MIEDIKKEVEHCFDRVYLEDKNFIIKKIISILDKYNNQPDYKSAWNELKNKTNEELKQATWACAGLNDTKISMQILEQKYNLGGE